MSTAFIARALGGLLSAAVAVNGCGGSTTPSPAKVLITDIKYEHVIPFAISADMQVQFEWWNCAGGPRDGPGLCALTKDAQGVFRCPDAALMDIFRRVGVATTCDHGIDVMIRSSTGSPLIQVAHNIYVNGTRVVRLTSDASLGYPREFGTFRIDASGAIR